MREEGSTVRGTAITSAEGVEVLRAAGVEVSSGSVVVDLVPSGNGVHRLRSGEETFFVKVPVKDLEPWPDPIDGAAVKVAREAAAAECLHRNGVAALEVLTTDTGTANPVGRPYLLSRAVDGAPFRGLMESSSRRDREALVAAVGGYLRHVHAIEFRASGYIVSADGPTGPTPPAPPRAAHDPKVAAADALGDLAQARGRVDELVWWRAHERLGSLSDRISSEYEPPRFVMGGFHTNHPHLREVGGGWQVVGCVDLEVASGGRVLDDLVTFAADLMLEVGGAEWWEPLFDGYEGEPPVEAVRDELLGSCVYLFGDRGDLTQTYRNLLDASSWSELFSAHVSGGS